MKRSTLQQIKDAALEQGLLLFLRPRFERYGEILDLSLDTVNKVITAEVRLVGEDQPLRVDQAHYRIVQSGEETRVVFYDIKVSREWAQRLLEDHFREIALKVPAVLRPLAG